MKDTLLLRQEGTKLDNGKVNSTSTFQRLYY